jgi:hypothetical protein
MSELGKVWLVAFVAFVPSTALMILLVAHQHRRMRSFRSRLRRRLGGEEYGGVIVFRYGGVPHDIVIRHRGMAFPGALALEARVTGGPRYDATPRIVSPPEGDSLTGDVGFDAGSRWTATIGKPRASSFGNRDDG